jgi:hypothetical protein
MPVTQTVERPLEVQVISMQPMLREFAGSLRIYCGKQSDRLAAQVSNARDKQSTDQLRIEWGVGLRVRGIDTAISQGEGSESKIEEKGCLHAVTENGTRFPNSRLAESR